MIITTPTTPVANLMAADHSNLTAVENQPLSGYIPTLDGWRAIAVAMVIVYHGMWESVPESLHELKLGFLGVDIFFALSGFLICSRLLQERRQEGRISLKSFYIRRAFRILPPAYAYLLALGVLTGLGWLVVHPSEFAGCLLLCRNYYPIGDAGRNWYTVHFWSLAVEEHFYLFFPALLAWYGRDIRRALHAVIVLAVAVALLRSLDGIILRWADGRLPAGAFHWTRTHVRLDALLWGCCAALLVERFRGLLAPWCTPSLSFSLLTLAVLSFWLPLGLMWRSLVLPWMVVGTALHPSGWAGRFLELAPLRWVGRISYSLYLWQQLFCIGGLQGVAWLGVLQTWPWNLMPLVVCASASYYLIERPSIRIGHRLAANGNRGIGEITK
jgi:peptidoglycan/LPS O-acetylase OafA/YrhL